MRQRLIAPLLLSEGTRHTVAKSTWSFRPWRVRFLFFFFFCGGGGGSLGSVSLYKGKL